MSASSDPAGLKSFVRRASQIMGYESALKADTHDALDDLLIAFASPYRIGFLDLAAEQILRVLAIAEVRVRHAWMSATQNLTLQGLANTVAASRVLQVLLATGEQPFEFGRVTQKTFSFRDPDLTFAAFVSVQTSTQQSVLAALEQGIPQTMSIADRSVLLTRLGELMQKAMLKKNRKHGAVVEKILSLQDGHEVRGLPSVAA
jgi:hypothetical protein